jgi:hypothetical protein
MAVSASVRSGLAARSSMMHGNLVTFRRAASPRVTRRYSLKIPRVADVAGNGVKTDCASSGRGRALFASSGAFGGREPEQIGRPSFMANLGQEIVLRILKRIHFI